MSLIEKTLLLIKEKLSGEASGHDYWHVYRVWQLAKRIAQSEKCDAEVVELAALLHDIADWKFNGGDYEAGPREARKWLESQKYPEAKIELICQIIREISFKGAKVADETSSIEASIVQDADRLDAIGAVGIARTFAYGGSKNRPMYEPNVEHELHSSFEDYKKSQTHTVNHFHEKLLLLKDKMKTKTGKELAKHRHEYMENFLKEFHQEWNGSS